ncbi:hypothetical protein [Novipirellula artificiosorum]|uniref:Secreted protein n=1 Tax=Novipirellula artificiosorum TaxID=2528016 RepID=A0A5C6E1K8_9BACT|nr:hypothetical protein [Novipirellula artificiosorum]TWU41019.1 hypothetical protein Poly41_18540 [Novipirellula artificiosorum]
MPKSIRSAASLFCLFLAVGLVVGCGSDDAGPHSTTNEIQSYLEENPDVVMTADDEPPSEEEQYRMSDAME